MPFDHRLAVGKGDAEFDRPVRLGSIQGDSMKHPPSLQSTTRTGTSDMPVRNAVNGPGTLICRLRSAFILLSLDVS